MWLKNRQNNQNQPSASDGWFCDYMLIIKKISRFVMDIYGIYAVFYFPMQNVKLIDYQWVTRYVVQMWFKFFGNNFHVAGTKTDLDSLQWDLRKLAQSSISKVRKMAETAKSMISLSGQKRKDYSGFIRIRQYTVFTTDYCSNRDYTYQYSQYGIFSHRAILYRFL